MKSSTGNIQSLRASTEDTIQNPEANWCSEEIFQKAYDSIHKHEGVVYAIYKDHLGHRTFGVGHLITIDDPEWFQPEGTTVNEDRVMDVYMDDLATAFTTVKRLVPDICSHPEDVQLVLTNMAFNLGQHRLSGFKRMLKAVEEKNYKLASVEMLDSRWAKQVSRRANELSLMMESAQ